MSFNGADGFNPDDPDAPKFGIDARRGFRAWCIPEPNKGFLHSTNWPYVWTPGVNVSTHYPKISPPWWGFGEHTADVDWPTVDCSCGFYAFHSEEYWADEPNGNIATHGPVITGVVEAFGRMVIASRGFRAQKALILALAVSPLRVSSYWLKSAGLGMGDLEAMVRESVQARYPSVPIYATVADLLAAHPLMGRPAA